MTYWRLLRLSLRYSVLHYVRYPVEWMSNYVGGAVLLIGILLGGEAAFHYAVGEKASALLFSFVTITALQAPLKFLEGRASEVEEVHLYPVNAAGMLVTYGVTTSLAMYFNLFLLYATLSLILHLPPAGLARMAYYLAPAFISMLGLGLILAGLQVLFKRLGALPNLLSILLLTAAFSPAGALSGVGRVFPAAQAFLGVQGLPVNQLSLWSEAAAYAVAGWYLFGICQRLMTRWGISATA